MLFVSVCLTLGADWVLSGARPRPARYLLPLSALLVLLAGIEFIDLLDRRLLAKRTAFALTLTVLLLGVLSMNEFSRFSYLWTNPPGGVAEAGRMRRMINYLKAEGVSHVFSMNGLLEWQVMFYSDENVPARSMASLDRYPAYVSEVDRALANGEAVAVVGYTDRSGAPGCQDIPICTGGLEGRVRNPAADLHGGWQILRIYRRQQGTAQATGLSTGLMTREAARPRRRLLSDDLLALGTGLHTPVDGVALAHTWNMFLFDQVTGGLTA